MKNNAFVIHLLIIITISIMPVHCYALELSPHGSEEPDDQPATRIVRGRSLGRSTPEWNLTWKTPFKATAAAFFATFFLGLRVAAVAVVGSINATIEGIQGKAGGFDRVVAEIEIAVGDIDDVWSWAKS